MPCRICLKSTTTMICLEDPLNETAKCSPSIHEALGDVMAVDVSINEKYPKMICSTCLGLLKIAYDLKVQFLESQEMLKRSYKMKVRADADPLELCFSGTFDESSIEGRQEITDDLQESTTIKCESEAETMEYLLLRNHQEAAEKTKIEQHNLPKVTQEAVQKYITDRNNETSTVLQQLNLKEEDLNLNLQNLGIKKDFDEELIKSALNQQYKCKQCKKIFYSETLFKIHYQQCSVKKNDETKYVGACYICNKRFFSNGQLTFHIKRDHLGMDPKENSIKPKKSTTFTCNICKTVCFSRSNFAYHKMKHTEKRFACDVCGKSFHTKNMVAVHKQVHQKENTRVLCPFCGKGFHYQSGLFYHMKIHTNEKKYMCEYCDKKFYALNILKRHQRTHTGNRPYACKFCEGKFRSLGEVKKHELTHTGVRPYTCKFCARGFTTIYNCKLHMLSHPGEFGCGFCDKTFGDQESLNFHFKLKHGKQVNVADDGNGLLRFTEEDESEDYAETGEEYEEIITDNTEEVL